MQFLFNSCYIYMSTQIHHSLSNFSTQVRITKGPKKLQQVEILRFWMSIDACSGGRSWQTMLQYRFTKIRHLITRLSCVWKRSAFTPVWPCPLAISFLPRLVLKEYSKTDFQCNFLYYAIFSFSKKASANKNAILVFAIWKWLFRYDGTLYWNAILYV